MGSGRVRIAPNSSASSAALPGLALVMNRRISSFRIGAFSYPLRFNRSAKKALMRLAVGTVAADRLWCAREMRKSSAMRTSKSMR